MYSIILVTILLSFSGLLQSEVIKEPVTNIHVEPEEDAAVDTQAIYGSSVHLIESGASWSKIQTKDGKEGWVRSSSLAKDPSFEQSKELRPVQNLFAHVYAEPDVTTRAPLFTLPYGAQVKPLKETDEPWTPVELISGKRAWMRTADIDFFPQEKTLDEVLSLSKKFLGLPFTSGGTSSYGFDCWGFVQMLFKEMGYLLPRDSKDQAQSPLLIPVAKEELQPGDLIFFGKTSITHVGLYLGNDEYIYSGIARAPMVMISTLEGKTYSFLAGRRLK